MNIMEVEGRLPRNIVREKRDYASSNGGTQFNRRETFRKWLDKSFIKSHYFINRCEIPQETACNKCAGKGRVVCSCETISRNIGEKKY